MAEETGRELQRRQLVETWAEIVIGRGASCAPTTAAYIEEKAARLRRLAATGDYPRCDIIEGDDVATVHRWLMRFVAVFDPDAMR